MQIPLLDIHGIPVPRFGLGTWEMGGRSAADTKEDKKWIAAIERALERGIRHIDTAEMYGNGHSEELVAAACAGLKRNDLFITTKVSGDNLRFDEVLTAASKSLKRLQTDYIDLYLIHWPNPRVPLAETMKAINRLLDEGMIRSFGLSNFPVKLMIEVTKLTDYPIITNQVEYNLVTRNNGRYNKNVESEIVPYCIENNISITAWRPVIKGETAALSHPLVTGLAAKYGKTPMQIALNWLVNRPKTIVIPKMTNEKHLIENLEVLGFAMEHDDYTALTNTAF